MFEFRPGEYFTISHYDAKPEGVPRNMLFLVKFDRATLPEGLEFSKVVEEPATAPRPYYIQMMRELDDGWSWDWPSHEVREQLGDFFLKIIEEYDEGLIGKWCWLRISIHDNEKEEPTAHKCAVTACENKRGINSPYCVEHQPGLNGGA